MNYITELNKMYHYLISKRLSKSEIALLHALYMVNNAEDWTVWFEVDNAIIQRLTGGYSRESINEARNKLKQRGRIDFKEGIRNTKSAKYKIISFNSKDLISDKKVDIQVDIQVDKKVDKKVDIQVDTISKQNINKTKKDIYSPAELNIIHKIVEHLNLKTSSNYKPTSRATQRHIKARLNEGYTLDDFIAVIDKKHLEWTDNPKMSMFLRPETLFGTKFEGYLNQRITKITTEDEVINSQNIKKNKFVNYDQRDWDFDELKQMEEELLDREIKS